MAKWHKQSDYCTSHQVLYHLGQHFNHCDVSNTSQGHGGSWEDEISRQDGLEVRKTSYIHSFFWRERWADLYSPYLFFTPNFIDGSLSPSFIWSVYNVIMHQAGSVDHFWDHSYGPLPWKQITRGQRPTTDCRKWDEIKTLDYASYNNIKLLQGVGALLQV